MKKLILLIALVSLSTAAWASSEPYGYPLVNPYEATVIGTPSLYAAKLPEEVPVKHLKLTVFPQREIPDIFWYQDQLRYSLAYQRQKAPLIFMIAGTGANYNSAKMLDMQKAFYEAGFHVISLPSPTYMNFIVTASSTGVPGHIIYDTQDLYHVMELAWQQVKGRIQVSDFNVTGYSLGAAQAAFVAKLDEDRRVFNFRKVLMINPPVSLYNSVQILDQMLVENIPGGLDNFSAFFDRVLRSFAEATKGTGKIDFEHDFLYTIYKKRPPKEENLAALIGISFRLSSMNMVLTSDVLTKSSFIVPREQVLTTATSLTDYQKVCGRTSFTDYFDGILYPYFKARQPELSRQALIDSLSLKSIEAYLAGSEKIGLMHNSDDLILAPGEIDFFKQVFKSRAKIYPNGGHCGNMGYKTNVADMVEFFKN